MPRLPRRLTRLLPRRRRPPRPRRPVPLVPFGLALGLTLVLAAAAAAGLIVLALIGLGSPDLPHGALQVTELLEVVKISLAVVAGVGGVVALVVAYRRQRLAEAGEAREHTKLYAERFTTAANQLGSDAPAVRLAGVHALAALADDWDGGRQMCIDVLCAYLRMPPEPEPDAEHDPSAHRSWRAMREVRATIIRLIAAHLHRNAPIPWHGHDLDFTGVVFDTDADFTHAVFSGGRVSFRGAEFSGSTVWFDIADFSGGRVSFVGAKFSGGRVSFDGAVFSDGAVWFEGAEFSGNRVSFTGAVFSENCMVSFNGAVFSDGAVSFDGAEFSGGSVWFYNTVFSGGQVDFTQVANWSDPPNCLPDQALGLHLPPQPAPQAAAESAEEATEQTKTGDGTGSPTPMP
ncbi:pentapeptide repeat-containing protein (plasmid) [Microtetraspora malaysiensis]|uniref:pentapeptide repeat-containing protein n=1 Tax=Microtetraspora malaysiensis TaxID=161358 RepID=UPI003D910FC1